MVLVERAVARRRIPISMKPFQHIIQKGILKGIILIINLVNNTINIPDNNIGIIIIILVEQAVEITIEIIAEEIMINIGIQNPIDFLRIDRWIISCPIRLIINNNPNHPRQHNGGPMINSNIITMNNHHNLIIKVNEFHSKIILHCVFIRSENRSDHDRRANGYTNQQSTDYSSNNSTSEQSNISSTQSYPSNLNAYNR